MLTDVVKPSKNILHRTAGRLSMNATCSMGYRPLRVPNYNFRSLSMSPTIRNKKLISDYEQVSNDIYQNQPTGLYHTRPKRIVVAITGATGIAIGVRVLQLLKQCKVETHLVMSKWGMATMKYETDYNMEDIMALASKVYTARDVSAPISSGSFQHDGMIVVPCSMKTLAGIRMGFTEDLIVRAADVTLKERRKLLLVTRETPLSDIHLDNMLYLSRMGTIIFPPVPAFYTKPRSVEDIIEQSSGRILDCFGIDTNTFPRWEGVKNTKTLK